SLRWQASEARSLVGAGALFWVSFILMMAARRVDQLVLHSAVSAQEFAAYAACMQILDNFTMLATILAAAIAPSQVYACKDFAVAHDNIGRMALFIGMFGLAGGLAVAACAPWIVQLLYGSEFEATVILLRVAAAASALVFVDVTLTLLAIYQRKPRWVAIKWAAVFLTTLAFDLIFIPRYGSLGAIAGYALGNAVAVVAGLAFWLHYRPARELASG